MRKRLTAIAALLAFATLASASAATLDVTNMPLADVVSMLSAQTGTNILVQPDIAKEAVTLHLGGLPARDLLRALADAYDLRLLDRGSYAILVSRKSTDYGFGSATIVEQVPPGSADAITSIIRANAPSVTVAQLNPGSVILTGSPDDVARIHRIIGALPATRYSTISTTYRSPSAIAKDLVSLNIVSPKNIVAADDPSGRLIVQGNEATIQALRSAVESLDQQPRRAAFTVQVLEVQPANDNSHIGILWGSPATGGTGGVSVNAGTATTSFVNKTGVFDFTTLYPVQIGNATAFTSQQIQYQPIGISLKITGTVGPRGEITGSVDAIDSTIDGFDRLGNPIIGKREASSNLTVYPDETLVLSGFNQDQDTEQVTRIPLLSSIPVLGELFKDRQKTHQQLQVVFLIRPTPIETKGATL